MNQSTRELLNDFGWKVYENFPRICNDLRRNRTIIPEWLKEGEFQGVQRNCYSTEDNKDCEYLKHGCIACRLTLARMGYKLIPRIREGSIIPNGISIREGKGTFLQIILRLPLPFTRKKEEWYNFNYDLFYINATVRRSFMFRFRVRSLSLLQSWNHLSWPKRIWMSWIFSFTKGYDVEKYDHTEHRYEAEERLGVENIFETCGNRQWSRQ